MPHIHTQPGHHDHTVSAYIILLASEPKILLHRHKKLKKFMQFGGHIELEEHPWQAIEHEIREESGYELPQLHVLQPKLRLKAISGAILHPTPIVYNTHLVGGTNEHYHSDAVYAFTTTQQPNHGLENGESSDILQVTRQQLIDLSSEQIVENSREMALFILDECLGNLEMVPAANYAFIAGAAD